MAHGLLTYLLVFLMVSTGGGASADQTPRYPHLLEKAKTYGSIRVIIGLKMPEYKPEGELPNSAAIKTQREGIGHLQDNLLVKLDRHTTSNVKKYITSPFIAMEIDLGGLQILIKNYLVNSIEEDIGVGLHH